MEKFKVIQSSLYLNHNKTIAYLVSVSRFYHSKDRFAHMILFLSNEIVSVSKEAVGDKILDDPLRVTQIKNLSEPIKLYVF